MAEISQNVNIEMLEKLPDGTYKRKYPKTKASQVKLEDTEGNFVATEVEGAMGELFTNVSDGKDLVGGAITDVDDSVVIPTDPTFGDLASAIGGISTGKKWASGVGVTQGKVAFATIYSSNVSLPVLIVNDLGFNPESVLIWDVSTEPIATILFPSDFRVGNAGVRIAAFIGIPINTWGNTGTYPIKLEGNAKNVNGFSLPVGSIVGQSYNWIAFE